MTTSEAGRTNLEVPGLQFSGDTPLVAVMRGEYVNAVHRGCVSVVRDDGTRLASAGDDSQHVFLRSAAKPFQVMPALLAGAVARFGLTQREVAILCASHRGERYHRDAVQGILRKAGLSEADLRCGIHPPIDQSSARELARMGQEPGPVCNNCSGAHTGMLLACVLNGWDTGTYGDPDHPLQVQTREILAEFTDIPVDEIEFGVDNCAVPTFHLPLDRSALAFSRLGTPGRLPEALLSVARQVTDAMTHNPEMIGGSQSFDTDLMAAAEGTVVAKGGAEGFQALGLIDQGVGIAMKITDGGERAIPITSLTVLRDLKVEAASSPALAAYGAGMIRNMLGEPVGQLVSLLRLDQS